MSVRDKAAVLELWRAVELFAPQPLRPLNDDAHVWSAEESSPLPWEEAHELRREQIHSRQAWQHTVFCGVYSIDEAFEQIRRRYPGGERMPQERPPAGESALAAFVVAHDGRPILDSAVLASCAWAVSQALREGLGSVATGPFAQLAAAFRLEWDGLVAADEDDEQATQLRAQGHSVGAPVDWDGLRSCWELARRLLKLEQLPKGDPLRNAHEIRIVSRRVSAREAYSPGEREFLNSFYAEDLRRVIRAAEDDACGRALDEYLTPASSIDTAARIDVAQDLHYVRRASSARRIPSGRWPSSPAHIASLGQQLALNTILSEHRRRLFAVNGPPGTGKTAMLRDLLAAIVVQRAVHLAQLERPADAFEDATQLCGRRRVHELRPQLTGFELVLACTTNTAAENVTAEIPAADAIDGAWRRQTDYFAAVATSMLNGPRAERGERQAWAMVSAVLGSRRRNAAFVKRFWFEGLRPQLSGGEQAPGAWGRTVAAFREALTRVQGLQEERSTCADLLEELRDVAHGRTGGADERNGGVETARREELERRIADARGLCEERFGAMVFPDESWAQPRERERRERQTPWLDERFDTARSELFLAALELHKAFVLGARRQMQNGLACVTELISGQAPSGVSEAAAKAAWQCLFMVVPLVSTTFASFPYLFRHLGEQAIGWLLIDEAGQATPQAAVGPLWRSSRAVVVGDPLQLEPISTVPVSIKNTLRREHGVDTGWLPNGASVQTLADQVAPAGTYRGDGSRRVWVGTPLNVHRRCETPMFEIVNEIAYENQMINCTPPRHDFPLPPSHWIDVPGASSNGNWVSAEGEALRELLEGLRFQMVDFTEVFAITPFRDVAMRISAHRRTFRGLRAGTIHTAQGREADIVILILGGSADQLGARVWAAEKPNLLNVAVSRAKRRLYVIGDHTSWAMLPHFKALAAALEPVRWAGARSPITSPARTSTR